MLKKLIGLLCVSCSLVCAMAGCDSGNSSSSSSASKIKIGFVVKQPEEPWFQNEWKFAQVAADQNGFELIKIGAIDGEKAFGAIDTLASSGAKGMVICTPDVKLGPSLVAKAKSRDIKLLAVDDQFMDNGKPMTDVPYLGISARKIGQSVGQALYDEMKKRNWPLDETALCVVTFDELDTARERTEGEIESIVAAGFPKEKIYRAAEKTSDVDGSFNAVNVLLTQQPGVKRWLITGMNDTGVLGTIRASEGRGFNADNVIAIGINGTDCIPEFERPARTGFFASVLLSARQHGAQTSEMMYKWIKDGVEPPKDTRTVGVIINRDNFQQVLKEQGVR